MIRFFVASHVMVISGSLSKNWCQLPANWVPVFLGAIVYNQKMLIIGILIDFDAQPKAVSLVLR